MTTLDCEWQPEGPEVPVDPEPEPTPDLDPDPDPDVPQQGSSIVFVDGVTFDSG